MASVVVAATVLVIFGIKKQAEKRRRRAEYKDAWAFSDSQLSSITITEDTHRHRIKPSKNRKLAKLLGRKGRNDQEDSEKSHHPILDDGTGGDAGHNYAH